MFSLPKVALARGMIGFLPVLSCRQLPCCSHACIASCIRCIPWSCGSADFLRHCLWRGVPVCNRHALRGVLFSLQISAAVFSCKVEVVVFGLVVSASPKTPAPAGNPLRSAVWAVAKCQSALPVRAPFALGMRFHLEKGSRLFPLCGVGIGYKREANHERQARHPPLRGGYRIRVRGPIVKGMAGTDWDVA